MTPEKILEVVGIYRKRLHEISITSKKHCYDQPLDTSWAGLCHVCTMLDNIAQFVKEGRIEKAFRWLGFVQGCLWFARLYTIGEMANHNCLDTAAERSVEPCDTEKA